MNISARYRKPSDEQWHNQINAKGYFCVSGLLFPTLPGAFASTAYAFTARWTKYVPTNETQWVEIVMVIFPGPPFRRRLIHPFIHYSLDVFLPFSKRPLLMFPKLLLLSSYNIIFINFHVENECEKAKGSVRLYQKYAKLFTLSRVNECSSEKGSDKRGRLIVVWYTLRSFIWISTLSIRTWMMMECRWKASLLNCTLV